MVEYAADAPRTNNPSQARELAALARAFYWRKLIDTGVRPSISDIARADGVSPAYVSRILRLTLLAPSVVNALTDGSQAARAMSLSKLVMPFTLHWMGQRIT